MTENQGCRKLIQSFLAMLRERQGEQLDEWVEQVEAREVPKLQLRTSSV